VLHHKTILSTTLTTLPAGRKFSLTTQNQPKQNIDWPDELVYGNTAAVVVEQKQQKTGRKKIFDDEHHYMLNCLLSVFICTVKFYFELFFPIVFFRDFKQSVLDPATVILFLFPVFCGTLSQEHELFNAAVLRIVDLGLCDLWIQDLDKIFSGS
jgi:hypothetical protein